ncbi:MAG: tail fiber domain-containing protein [Verrucomicrobia bacterium]|nr:tail fiber domain-containing protein [Verrucomicrobiota bacterium]
MIATGDVKARGVVLTSDGRIKQITGRPAGEASLESIRRLAVTDYRYVDTALHGGGTRRGLIAQEVEKVLPNAVTQRSNFVPDIYAPAATSQYEAGGKTLTIELKDPHGLKLGDMVSLNLDNNPKELKVVAVPSLTRFAVETENQPGKVFVSGKQVNDFRSVDYNQVFSTGISAIQELDKQVQALKKSEARIAELEEKAARVDSLEREMAEMKKLVAGLTQGQTPGRFAARQAATPAGQ